MPAASQHRSSVLTPCRAGSGYKRRAVDPFLTGIPRHEISCSQEESLPSHQMTAFLLWLLLVAFFFFLPPICRISASTEPVSGRSAVFLPLTSKLQIGMLLEGERRRPGRWIQLLYPEVGPSIPMEQRHGSTGQRAQGQMAAPTAPRLSCSPWSRSLIHQACFTAVMCRIKLCLIGVI